MTKVDLHFGDTEVFVNKEDGFIGPLYRNDTCILYRLTAALRDVAWGTPMPLVRLVEERNTTCKVDGISEQHYIFDFDYRRAGYDLSAALEVHIADSSVSCTFSSVAERQFIRNRFGLYLLIPATLAGEDLTVEHSDGVCEGGAFPVSISPHQPAMDISALTFHTGRHCVEVRFSGDVFEMEDQRNWGDFTYKVYCTPLSLPFPVTVHAGERIDQRIEVSIDIARAPDSNGTPESAFSRSGPTIAQSTTPDARPQCPQKARARPVNCTLPGIGSRLTATNQKELESISVFQPSYIRLDVDDEGVNESMRLAPQIREAVDLYLWSDSEIVDVDLLQLVQSWCRVDPVSGVTRDAPIPRTPAREARPTASTRLVRLIGTDGAFAELNRARPKVSPDDEVIYTFSPQVHDRVDEIVIDNLIGFRDTLRFARELYPDNQLVIGLAEMTPHFNPAAGDRTHCEKTKLHDSRLETGFAAAWSFALICEAAAGGVFRLALFDTHGEHGIVQDDELIPAAQVLRDLGILSGIAITVLLPPRSVSGERLYAAFADPPGMSIAAAANLGTDTISTSLTQLAKRAERVRPDGSTQKNRPYRWTIREIRASEHPLQSSAFEWRRRMVRIVTDSEAFEIAPRSYVWMEAV